jgi:4-hydroxy-tetrahydrodipicolinate synthase
VVELAEDALGAGVEATQVYSLDLGHGYLPTADEQRTYLRTVLDRAPGDLVVSTHQSVGYHYEPTLLDEVLADYPRVVGVNVTHRDLVYVAEVVDAVGGRVDVHVGGPMHALGATALGATGYLSSEGNLAPRLCVSVLEHLDSGDRDGAAHLHGQVMEIHVVTQALGGIVGTKAALRLLGAPGGWPRPPRLPVAPERAQALVDVLVRLGVADDEGLR